MFHRRYRILIMIFVVFSFICIDIRNILLLNPKLRTFLFRTKNIDQNVPIVPIAAVNSIVPIVRTTNTENNQMLKPNKADSNMETISLDDEDVALNSIKNELSINYNLVDDEYKLLQIEEFNGRKSIQSCKSVM